MDFVKAIASTVIGIVMADVVTGLIDPKEQHQQEHQLAHFTRDGMNKDIFQYFIKQEQGYYQYFIKQEQGYFIRASYLNN